jgi:menaquinone-dependent protoporphyrinogen oxidase
MSHHGTTRKIAGQMAQTLGKENATVLDFKKADVPDLGLFDTVLIGGSIHAGQIQKKIRMFCVAYEKELLQKRIGLFMCALETAEKEEEFNNAFPERLRNHAIAHGYFGGELLLDKMNFFEKHFVKTIYGIKTNLSQIDANAIDEFCHKIAH